MPNYIDADALPTLTWADGTPLSSKEQASFYARLAMEAPDHRDDLARRVASQLDPDRAGELSRALWDGFVAGREKASHKWLVYQLGVIGDFRVWNALCPQLDERSAGHGYHQVEWVLEAMARRETIEASSWLWYVARSAQRSRAEDPALKEIRALAHASKQPPHDYVKTLRWHIAQRAEDESWKLWLDTFPTSLPISEDEEARLMLAEDFQLILQLPGGKTQKSVPKGAPDASKETFKELKKSLTARKHEVIDYIERMMIAGRSWTQHEFKELFARHTFMEQVASSLVFIDPDTQQTCRYSEGAFVDVDWESIDPFERDGQIKLLHPCNTSQHTLEQWADHLAEGEELAIVQQIGRPYYPREYRPGSAEMAVNKVMGRFQRHGWIIEGASYDDASTSSRKRFPDLGLDLTVSHPPIYVMGSWEDTTTGEVKLLHIKTSLGEKVIFDDLSLIAHSELCLAMAQLTE